MLSIPFHMPADISTALRLLLDQFYSDALLIRGVADETVVDEVRYIVRFFRYLGWPDGCDELFNLISPRSIACFLAKYSCENTPGSLRWMQSSLRTFLSFAYRSSFVERNLSMLVPQALNRQLRSVPRALPDEAIVKLRSGVDRSTVKGLRDSALIALLSIYGVRGVQLRRLRLNHIDWRNDRIIFPAAKGGRTIEQQLVSDAGNFLCEYLRKARPGSDYPEVFLTLREPFRPIPDAAYLSRTIGEYIDRLELKLAEGVSHGSHGFRHAFASRMVGKIPFKDLVDQLGHRKSASTLVYCKVDLNGLNQAALPWPGGVQ
jgi:integrase/recombinase XerD